MLRTVFLRGVLVGSLTAAVSACGGSPPVAPSTLSGLAVTGTASLTTAGQASQLTATATLSDNSTQNVTSSATWLSSNPGVATISSAGLLTAVATGTTTITATSQSKSGTLAVTVSIASASTTFQGTVAGTAGQRGTLTITIQTVVAASSAFSFSFPFVATLHAQATVPATGGLNLVGGSIVTLNGTYDSAGKLVTLSGHEFTFRGTISGGVLSGTWTGPDNAAGSFSSLNSTSSTVTAYCGTFTSTFNEEGVLSLQISTNGTVAGASQVKNNPSGFCPFTGQLTGSALTLTNCEQTKLTGTVQGGTASGGGTASDGSRMTFTASTSACQ